MIIDLNCLLGLFFGSLCLSVILFVLCNSVCETRTERMFVYFWSIFFSVLAILFCFLLLWHTIFASDAVFTWVKS